MNRRLSRFLAAALVAVCGAAMLAATFDAEARRMGGGGSFGRQSANVATKRQATPPAAAPTAGATQRPGATAAAAGTGAAAGATAGRSAASRWFGPIAGIAAGLGLAALLSHLGLGAAFAEFMASMLLIALVVFAVLFLVRRLRGGMSPALQGAARTSHGPATGQPAWRESLRPADPAPAASGAAGTAAPVAVAPLAEGDWAIPAGFDTARFLQQAKQQFIHIQKIWDSGDLDQLREYLTDDLFAEMQRQLTERKEPSYTEVVLLNAELLGIEKVEGGHLASVRFSGMLREAVGAEAFRFEEVWNLFKSDDVGWLLAGIQQIPVEYAS